MVRLQEHLKAVAATLAEDRVERKERDKQITQIATEVTDISHRLATVEQQMASNAPTIQEFVLIKQRAVGAGWMGKWAWALAFGTITILYNGREAIKNFFLGH